MEEWLDPRLVHGGHVATPTHDLPRAMQSEAGTALTTAGGEAAPLTAAAAVTTSSWIKIELLGTDRAVRGEGLARLLLAMALAFATAVQGKTSALLQVAGGEDNVAASALYSSFGFVGECLRCPPHPSWLQLPPLPLPVAPPDASSHFHEPNKQLRAVWDISKNLRALAGSRRVPNKQLDSLAATRRAEAPATPRELRTAELLRLPSAQLKEQARQCRMSDAGCVEKADLVRRVVEAEMQMAQLRLTTPIQRE